MSTKLRELVDKIKYLRNWTTAQVAESVNYTRVHLQNEMKKGNAEIEKLLKERHSDILQNVKPEIQLEVDESKILSNIVEQVAAIKATIKVITPTIIKLEALSRNESTAKISLEFEQMILQQTEQILGELTKRFSS